MGKTNWCTVLLVLVASVAFGVFLTGAPGRQRRFVQEKFQKIKVDADAALEAHTKEFEKQIIKVTDGVWVGIGYGLANSVLIEGDDGVVVVDTLENVDAARKVRAAFKEVVDKPIKALILTHNHADHVLGAQGFLEDDQGQQPEDPVDVYAHQTTLKYLDRVLSVTNMITYRRAMRQFGSFLDKDSGHLNSGIGPRLHDPTSEGLLRPNKLFDGDKLEVTIAGVRLELLFAPGETNDQIVVWLPDKRVLCAADNVYRAFPNLYAIRGTPARDTMQWVRSLDLMRSLGADFMVPSHTKPVVGSENVASLLVSYRDAIQFVHDQTVRYMNHGLTPDEIVQLVHLPPHLEAHPFLQQFYGTVEWSVRGVFSGYLGWFSGRAADLSPEPPATQARRLVELAGGAAQLADALSAAVDQQQWQWALELSDALLLHAKSGGAGSVDLVLVRGHKVRALRGLAAVHPSANGRNYLLTQAMEVEGHGGLQLLPPVQQQQITVQTAPLRLLFNNMAVRLKAENALETDTIVGFRFPDVQEEFTVHVRRGVCDVQSQFPQEFDLSVTCDSQVWRDLVAGKRNPAAALVSGELNVEGASMGATVWLAQFLLLFERPER